MTPNEIAVQIAEPLGRAFDIPYRAILKDRLVYWYARMMKNSLDKDPKRRRQVLGYFKPLVLTCSPENAERGARAGAYGLLAVTDEIPSPLMGAGILFDYVGSADGTTPFIKAENEAFDRFGSHDKYLATAPRYLYSAGRFELSRNPDIRQIRIDYIPENPRKFAEYLAGCDGEICNWDDQEFLLPQDIMQLVMESMANEARPANPNTPREEVKVDAK